MTVAARRLTPTSAIPFAAVAGLAVADVYYAVPLLDTLAGEFGVDRSTIGVIVTTTQIGYALGLALLAPLGDRFDRRRLIGGQTLRTALSLVGVALAPDVPYLLAALALVGLLAVLAQVLVAAAASLAGPADRGRIVGVVTSGIVLGILLARTVAGVLAEVAGWRSVYLVSAAAMLVAAVPLLRALPRRVDPPTRTPYPRLVASTFRLFAEVPILRARAALAFLVFMALNVLLAPMALALAAPPYALSTGQIGLFGLAGVAGAFGATSAGRLTDRALAATAAGAGGRGRDTATRVGLLAMLDSWTLIATLPWTLVGPVLGVLLFDFGLQSVHVAGQGLVYQVRPEAQSRLTAAYMLAYSAGSAVGAITATTVYAAFGWTGVSILGASTSAVALLFWAGARHAMSSPETTRGDTP